MAGNSDPQTRAAKRKAPEAKPEPVVQAARETSNTRKELVREALLEKTAELFATRGYARTSINDIADSLSLKRSSVYHYFPNKEAILRELFVVEYDQRLAEIEAVQARRELSSQERLNLVVEGAIGKRLQNGGRFLALDRMESEVPEDLRRGYNRARRRILDLYTQIVEDGVAAGEFRPVDPQLTAFALIGISNWPALWYSPYGKKKPAEIARALTDLLVNGISQPAAPGEDPPETTATPEALLGNLQRDLDSLKALIDRDEEG
ncbi:TetR/AcrR family transcriptional regulator [Pararhodobacter oceanensis]|uniref:TetR/AcrR family transcriptional regulator n=1 Tax=Pararhodobacter oceanensis TaxID=2172121 RepID=UPI003A910E60